MKWLGASLLCLMVVSFATPAAAQDTPRAEISGGYNFFAGKASGDEEWEKFKKGWYADVAGNVTETIGIVGQVTGNYKTFEDPEGDFDLKIHTYMFGVRGSSPGRVRGFGQVLIGAANIKGSEAQAGGFSASETDLAFQVGGGVNVLNTGNVGFRAGVDYLRIKAKDDGEVLEGASVNGFRFNVGIVIGF